MEMELSEIVVMLIFFVLGGSFFIGLFIVLLYNNLIAKKNNVENLWGAIDTQLKKRFDLIPNLVATVQQHTEYEKETLTKITELREQLVKSTDTNETVALSGEISSALNGFMLKAEAYPELKASESFIHLQKTVANTEEEISATRRSYNQAVTDYNDAIEMFPSNLVAKKMKYERKMVLEIPEIERKNIDIKNLFQK
jgi:LemA protein